MVRGPRSLDEYPADIAARKSGPASSEQDEAGQRVETGQPVPEKFFLAGLWQLGALVPRLP